MDDTTRQGNVRIIQRLYDESFNQGALSLLDETVGPEYVGPQGERGPEGFRGLITGLRTGFPDIHYEIQDVTAQDDRVAVRWRWTGTHRAPYRGIAPTNAAVSTTGMAIFRLQGGRIVAASIETDRLGFLQSLGLVPAQIPGLRPPSPAPAASQ